MATPTNAEQELLELINRARLDPVGEINRLITSTSPLTGANSDITSALNFFHVDVNVLRQQLTGVAAVAPLAWNSNLGDAASLHSAKMIQVDEQTHQAAGEADLLTRVQTSGYNNLQSVGENVYAFGTNTLQAHAGFFIDWGTTANGIQSPAGHRANILSSGFTEVGIDATPENNGATQVGPLVVTEDFGSHFGYSAQVLGVVFRDADGDNFYDAGEGLGGKSVSLTGTAGTFSTTTWSSGGYQLSAPAGTYTITFSGSGMSTKTSTVTLGSQNVKVDDNDAAGLPHAPGLNPVYRFFDSATNDHFYTLSAQEASNIRATLATYHDEGSPWSTPDKAAGTVDVFRFFDSATGAHFLTSSVTERDQVIATLASYHYEGVAFEAYQTTGPGTLTLERFFNTQTKVHHYSGSTAETASILAGNAGPNWVDEGPGFIVHT